MFSPRIAHELALRGVDCRAVAADPVLRIVGGCAAAAAGIICLAYGVWGWAAFFLAIAALNLAGGSWFLSIARSRAARA